MNPSEWIPSGMNLIWFKSLHNWILWRFPSERIPSEMNLFRLKSLQNWILQIFLSEWIPLEINPLTNLDIRNWRNLRLKGYKSKIFWRDLFWRTIDRRDTFWQPFCVHCNQIKFKNWRCLSSFYALSKSFCFARVALLLLHFFCTYCLV